LKRAGNILSESNISFHWYSENAGLLGNGFENLLIYPSTNAHKKI